MRRSVRAVIFVVVGLALAPFLWIGFWVFLAPFIPPVLSPLLPKPPGFPPNATVTTNLDDGTSWWYCKSTPSGHVWIGSDGQLKFKFGSRCNDNRRYYYNPAPSVEMPGLIVDFSGGISFSVPRSDNFAFQADCPFEFSTIYYDRSRKLILETAKLDDIIIQASSQRLRLAIANINTAQEQGLETAGFSGDTYFCGPKRQSTRKSALPVNGS